MEAADEGGVTIKQVKLKVLYTFDSEHKNNHLARWPHSIEVQVAPIDDTSVIGIINLRTCIEAIITSSPELTSNLDNDYAVYAYDYSEPDTPLVGQGMLSKALLGDNGEDQDSEAMVTGKITKSVMGLFSKNAQETLEVKLRLTPVASGFQRRRSGSVSSNPDTVQQQWNTLSQSNGAFRPSSPMDTSALENMQRMLSEGGPRAGGYQTELYHHSNSRPGSRNGTPVQLQQFNALPRQSGPQSRPSSRSEVRQTHARRDSFNSGYYSGEDIVEEGPARKRAKIQKVDWPSKSNLNIERQPDSLRVVASTASSVRLHRPVPQYPGIVALQHGSPTEEPIRPPTPIPTEKQRRPRGRPKKVVSSNLLLGPKARQSSPARRNDSADPSVSSPEDVRADSVTSTPAPIDLPSSPPVMPERQNLVTSPALPPMNETDSGFMSGALDDLFDNNDLLDFDEYLQDKNGVPNTDFDTGVDMDIDLAAVFDEGNDVEQPTTEMPPPNDKPDVAYKRPLARAQSMGSSNLSMKSVPKLAPALAPRNSLSNPIHMNQRAHTTLPPIPASDPIGRTFQRSNTWAPDMSDAIMSDLGPNGDDAKSKSKKRVGKEQTKARLEQAIASGEMPPFCDNCGAIETPAWRRAYTKLFYTPFDEFQTSLEQGECCYKEPVEHNDDGSVKAWKGYRTEKRADEKSADTGGWTQICLCNPCGLWFHKSKYPRPPEKWQKRDPNEKRKRKRKPKPKKKCNRPIVAKSDAITPASDESSPGDDAADGGDGDDYGDEMTANEDNYDDCEPQLPPMPVNYRAGSAEPISRGLRGFSYRKPTGDRQTQSSPAHTNKMVSVNTNTTPRPLRRQLFPSPDSLQNKADAVAMLITSDRSQLPAFVRRSPRLNKTRDVYAGSMRVSPVVEVEGDGKENIAPVAVSHDPLNNLFEDHDNDLMLPPATPTPKRRSERLLFKTPGRTPSREFGTALDQNMQENSPSLKTPKNKIQHAASVLISTVQRNLNPSEMTPFTRSIHDALHNQVSLELPSTPRTRGSARSTRTPRRISPHNTDLFDFPDLPSLQGSSPSNGAPPFALTFSELPTDRLHTDFNDMFSTDAHMPSSPPSGYFNFMDMAHQDITQLWDIADSQNNESTGLEPSTDKDGVASMATESGAVRRSPRRHVG